MTMQTPLTRLNWREVFATSFPVMMGYIPMGMAFGYLLHIQGVAWWLVGLMSICVYAGAAQFMVIPMLVAHAPVSAIALATLIVNLRHIFYGLSLLGKMPAHPFKRLYLIFALTDETYSLLTTLDPQKNDNFRVALAAMNHSWWVLGSLLGALIAGALPARIEGVEFSLTALFVVLTIEQAYAGKRYEPFAAALLSYGLAWILMPSQTLSVSLLLATLIGIFYIQCRGWGQAIEVAETAATAPVPLRSPQTLQSADRQNET